LYLEIDDYFRSQLVAKQLLTDRMATPPPAEIAAWRIAYPRAFRQEVETYAAQFGLEYARPTTGRAFIKAYQKALCGPRHSIIEIRTDRDENRRLHRALEETISRRLDSGVIR